MPNPYAYAIPPGKTMNITISPKYLNPGPEVLSLLAKRSAAAMRQYAEDHPGVEVCGDDESLRIITKGWVMDSPSTKNNPNLWIRPTGGNGDCWVRYNPETGMMEGQDYDTGLWVDVEFDA
jgi:hypothetical protein